MQESNIFTPLRDEIVLLPDDVKETSADGLIITESARLPVFSGKVIAIGARVKDLNVGDHVFYRRGLSDLVVYKDIKYIFATENNVITKINE